MPFPWKKNKVTRISQIVADLHLQSPKRGGSLVVQTGFPTSLIDLFVKNRSRFKKPKSKKPLHDPPPPSPASPPPQPETLDSTDPVVAACAEAPRSLRQSVGLGENVHGVYDRAAGSGWEGNRVGECAGGSDANTVVVALFLKMFVVVVLTMSVRKLTVGITMSAFALLFLEYAGKRAVSCLRPNANMTVKSLAQRVSTCIWFQRLLQLKIKMNNCEGGSQAAAAAVVEGEIVLSELVGVAAAELSSNSLSIEEIEVVETKCEVGIYCEETNFAVPDLDEGNKWGCPQMQEDSKGKVVVLGPCEISECKVKVSRSGRFKSTMVKKLVPKKLRGSKKEKKGKKSKECEAESGSEVSSTVEEDKSPSFEIEEEQEGVGKEEEDNNRSRSPLLLNIKLECIRDDEVDHGTTCSQESPLAMGDEEVAIDRVGNSGYIILLIIALAGLVLGRFPALMLTITWCFMLKIVKTRGRSQNVPLFETLDGTLGGLR